MSKYIGKCSTLSTLSNIWLYNSVYFIKNMIPIVAPMFCLISIFPYCLFCLCRRLMLFFSLTHFRSPWSAVIFLISPFQFVFAQQAVVIFEPEQKSDTNQLYQPERLISAISWFSGVEELTPIRKSTSCSKNRNLTSSLTSKRNQTIRHKT